MKYVLEMNEKQASIVMAALEFYSRMRLGQFGELPRLSLDLSDEEYHDKAEYMEALLELARRRCYPELSYTLAHSYGIGKFEDADMAWEIYTSIRHCVSWANNPEGGMSVCFDEPRSFRGNEIAKCTVVKDDEAFIEK